jgi:hypothetical protein
VQAKLAREIDISRTPRRAPGLSHGGPVPPGGATNLRRHHGPWRDYFFTLLALGFTGAALLGCVGFLAGAGDTVGDDGAVALGTR